jgi:hypothetical protein
MGGGLSLRGKAAGNLGNLKLTTHPLLIFRHLHIYIHDLQTHNVAAYWYSTLQIGHDILVVAQKEKSNSYSPQTCKYPSHLAPSALPLTVKHNAVYITVKAPFEKS